jgi:hypothetical protein
MRWAIAVCVHTCFGQVALLTPCGVGLQEGYWRKDTHQTELYKCRLSVCLGEAQALQALHQGVSYQSDQFNRTLSAAERTTPIELDSCRDGHTGRLCQVCVSPSSYVSPSLRDTYPPPLSQMPLLAHLPLRALPTIPIRVVRVLCLPMTYVHPLETQACKDGYTVQGIYCARCSGTADPTVKAVAAPLGTAFILFIFGSWCLRPYFAKAEANLRRMASEQGARLSSSISRHFQSYRNQLAKDVQMQVSSHPCAISASEESVTPDSREREAH